MAIWVGGCNASVRDRSSLCWTGNEEGDERRWLKYASNVSIDRWTEMCADFISPVEVCSFGTMRLYFPTHESGIITVPKKIWQRLGISISTFSALWKNEIRIANWLSAFCWAAWQLYYGGSKFASFSALFTLFSTESERNTKWQTATACISHKSQIKRVCNVFAWQRFHRNAYLIDSVLRVLCIRN